MDRPSECKWCGAGQLRSATQNLLFDCFTVYQVDDNQWRRDTVCIKRSASQILELRDRIQRALDKIKASKRWSAEKNAKTPIAYHPDPDGWIARASDLDEVARILEGDADGE